VCGFAKVVQKTVMLSETIPGLQSHYHFVRVV